MVQNSALFTWVATNPNRSCNFEGVNSRLFPPFNTMRALRKAFCLCNNSTFNIRCRCGGVFCADDQIWVVGVFNQMVGIYFWYGRSFALFILSRPICSNIFIKSQFICSLPISAQYRDPSRFLWGRIWLHTFLILYRKREWNEFHITWCFFHFYPE